MISIIPTNEHHDVCKHYVVFDAEENAREPKVPRAQRIKREHLVCSVHVQITFTAFFFQRKSAELK